MGADVGRRNALQAEAEYKHNDKPVKNMHAVVNMSVSAVQSRWRKYEELFESVKTTVSCKFHSYMHRRGHQVYLHSKGSVARLSASFFTSVGSACARVSMFWGMRHRMLMGNLAELYLLLLIHATAVGTDHMDSVWWLLQTLCAHAIRVFKCAY